ncbi:MAG: histidine-type phosphatase [Atopobiaceae bacterium]|nr:histidine-type phosphatase [Atopobiaceae bacterium]
MKQRKHVMLVVGLLAMLLAFGPLVGCGTQPANDKQADESAETEMTKEDDFDDATTTSSTYERAWQPRDGYTLKRVVAMSRHNLRAPQQKDMDTLTASTPHEWVKWSSNGSELTVKGGVAETIMGEFFRKWLESEQLIPENYIPAEGEVRFYANPRQRTLATTQFFSSGMLPVANARIEYHGEYDSRDPVFKPRFDFVSDAYTKAATDQIATQDDNLALADIDKDLQGSYDLITKVLDYKNSQAYQSGDAKDLETGDTTYQIAIDEEPSLTGSLKDANKLSDALSLQYFEANDLTEAAFGTELSQDEWKQIVAAKNAYGDRRYNSKLVSVNCAHLLVSEIAKELGTDGRRFSFLCGHDSNQSSLLHALGVTDYTLPDTIETKTPIGGKILFEVYENASGEQFCNIRYVYATSDQVRNLSILSLEQAPASFDLDFEGLARNADGLFALADVQQLLADTVAAYDQLAVDYPADAAAQGEEAATGPTVEADPTTDDTIDLDADSKTGDVIEFDAEPKADDAIELDQAA